MRQYLNAMKKHTRAIYTEPNNDERHSKFDLLSHDGT